jgi:hypothetical protein
LFVGVGCIFGVFLDLTLPLAARPEYICKREGATVITGCISHHRFCSLLELHGLPRDKDYVKELSSLEMTVVRNVVLSSVLGNDGMLGLKGAGG